MTQRNAPLVAGGLQALEARYARRVTAALSEHADALPHDLTERLRFAREQALAKRRSLKRREAAVVVGSVQNGPSLALTGFQGQGGGSWWSRLGATLGTALPVFVLVAGLVLIQDRQSESQISAAAEIDAALLADELPPQAYSDPGFVEFLKTPSNLN